MIHLATDWYTISSLATGAGTLVLAVATFAAVKSSNRSARIAEMALQEQRRPLLAPSRLEDPLQKLGFVDGHWVKATGGHASVEHIDGTVYLAMSLRNVGAGIAVCQAWSVTPGMAYSAEQLRHTPLEEFRWQSRDMYIPAGDIGMWQGALRDPDAATRALVAEAIDSRQPLTIELLYTDQLGRQRTVTRFAVIPAGEGDWFVSMSRHWYLDWEGPRSDEQIRDASGRVRAEREAAERLAALRREEARQADARLAAERAAAQASFEESISPETPFG